MHRFFSFDKALPPLPSAVAERHPARHVISELTKKHESLGGKQNLTIHFTHAHTQTYTYEHTHKRDCSLAKGKTKSAKLSANVH